MDGMMDVPGLLLNLEMRQMELVHMHQELTLARQQ